MLYGQKKNPFDAHENLLQSILNTTNCEQQRGKQRKIELNKKK